MDIHVDTWKTYNITVQKNKIIVGLLQMMQIMMEVHGVIYLVVKKNGIGVAYQYVEVSKFIPIQTIRSGLKQISEDSLELIKSRCIFSYNSIKTFHWHFQNDDPFNDNISVACGGPGILVKAYCDPFLADLLINWYQVDFIHK